MPYQVGKYVKYASKKYPAIRKRARVYVPAVRQLASDVMYLKGLINSEPKTFEVTSSSNFSYNGFMVSLCNVAQGDGGSSRDGNRILPRYLNLRFHVNRIITAPTNPHTTIRYIVFRWWGESPNTAGVAPAAADVLQASAIATQFAPMAPLNHDVTGSKGDRNRRIEVHRTGMITLDSVSKTSMDEELNITLNGGNKVKEHIEYYDSTTAPPTSGGFFVLFINDNSVTTDCAFYLYSRLTFYDN